MSQTRHVQLINEWVAEQEASPCSCGGKVCAGWTVPRVIPVEDRFLWETIVHANCVSCGKGEQVAITEAGES